MLRHGLEGLVDAAGLLARADGLHEGLGQQLAAAVREAGGEAPPVLHVLGHVPQHPLQRLVRGLVRHQMHRPRDRDARPQDDGELIAHDREGLGVQARPADLHVQDADGVLLPHLSKTQHHVAALLDACRRVQLVEALDHAGNALPAAGDRLIFIRGQPVSPLFSPSVRDPCRAQSAFFRT